MYKTLKTYKMKTTKTNKTATKIGKILVVSNEIREKAWNKSLPVPLIPNGKVIVHASQKDVVKGYVRIRHGKGNKHISVFSLHNFKTLSGKSIKV